MRTFLTLLTLGAASAGYIYLQPTHASGEPGLPPSLHTSVTDWQRNLSSKTASSRVPVKELIDKIHEHTKSALDEFANQYGGHSDAPIDDAFHRLQQVAQTISDTTTPRESAAPSSTHPAPISQRSLPNVSELQRTAFESIAAQDDSKPKANQQADHQISDLDAIPPEQNSQADSRDVKDTADDRPPVIASNRPDSDRVDESGTADSPASNRNQISAKETSQRTSSAPPKRRVENKYANAEWKVVGKTTEGRPMHSMHLGDVGTRTLVIAGLNGEDRTAVRWLELLAEELKRRPEFFEKNQVVFFRAGNPDGLVRNLRNNARNVPLNRNFPGRQYRPNADFPTGAAPAGEQETRVMLETLYSFRPRRVIHLTSTSGASRVLYNRLAKPIAAELERSASLEIQPLEVDQLPGSLEDFTDGTLEAAMLTSRLNTGKDWQETWSTLRLHLVGAVVGQPIEIVRGDPVKSADLDREPIPIESVSRRPHRKGYEELPPPP